MIKTINVGDESKKVPSVVVNHCYSEISDFSSRRAEFGRLAVLGWSENLPEPLDGVTV